MKNILLLSVGTRNKIVEYFKKTLIDENENKIGNLIVTDMSELAPAIYEADKYYIVPSITDSSYIDIILDICEKEEISAVLSFIDPELSVISKNIDRFHNKGVEFIGSSYDICELSLDKYEMYMWLKKQGFNCAKSYIDKDEFYKDLDSENIHFPVFVKPARGSASIAISKVYDKDTVDLLFSQSSGLMIQEFLDGQEIGADVYIDMISGKPVSIFTKKKLKMRAGETDKSVSFKDTELFNLIENFVTTMGYRGQIDIDIFDVDGEYYISEVNPRFGGGYPHAYECGCDHMKLILNNLNRIENEKNFGAYKEGVYMMKYNEVLIKELG